MSIVLESGSEIAGIALLMIDRRGLTVEMLARNRHVAESKVGLRLLNCIEECVAHQLGIDRIRLDSLYREKLIDFYRKRGFVNEGPAIRDREWGLLQPMYKMIANLYP